MQPSIYESLAYSVAVLHGIVVAWVFFGGFLARRYGWLVALHLFCAAWGLFTTVTKYPCPLTTLENTLRSHGNIPTYSVDCIVYYFWAPLALPTGPYVPLLVLAPAVLLNCIAYWPTHHTGDGGSTAA